MEITKNLTAYAEAMARLNQLPLPLQESLRNGTLIWRDHALYTGRQVGANLKSDLSVSSDTKVPGKCNYDRQRTEANTYFMVVGLRLLQGVADTVEACDYQPLAGNQLNGELDIKIGSTDVIQGMSLRKFASADPATPGYYRLDAPFMIVPQTEIVPTITFPVAGDPKLCVRLEFDGVIIRKK